MTKDEAKVIELESQTGRSLYYSDAPPKPTSPMLVPPARAWYLLGDKAVAEIVWRQLDESTGQSIFDTIPRRTVVTFSSTRRRAL